MNCRRGERRARRYTRLSPLTHCRRCRRRRLQAANRRRRPEPPRASTCTRSLHPQPHGGPGMDPAKLPIRRYAQQIVDSVRANPVTVVIGETGSGKTTQISQILEEAGFAEHGVIGVTQPRRVVSARGGRAGPGRAAAVHAHAAAPCRLLPPPPQLLLLAAPLSSLACSQAGHSLSLVAADPPSAAFECRPPSPWLGGWPGKRKWSLGRWALTLFLQQLGSTCVTLFCCTPAAQSAWFFPSPHRAGRRRLGTLCALRSAPAGARASNTSRVGWAPHARAGAKAPPQMRCALARAASRSALPRHAGLASLR